jgi:hypothetical protein
VRRRKFTCRTIKQHANVVRTVERDDDDVLLNTKPYATVGPVAPATRRYATVASIGTD